MRNWARRRAGEHRASAPSSLDTRLQHAATRRRATYPGGIISTNAGYARNLYGVPDGPGDRPTAPRYYLQPDGSYLANGERTNGDDRGRHRVLRQRLVAREAEPHVEPGRALRGAAADDGRTACTRSRETWQMVYGVDGRGRRALRAGQPLQAGDADGHDAGRREVRERRPRRTTPTGTTSRPSVGVAWRPERSRRGCSARCSARTRCSAAATR